jgi:hypothetical protein
MDNKVTVTTADLQDFVQWILEPLGGEDHYHVDLWPRWRPPTSRGAERATESHVGRPDHLCPGVDGWQFCHLRPDGAATWLQHPCGARPLLRLRFLHRCCRRAGARDLGRVDGLDTNALPTRPPRQARRCASRTPALTSLGATFSPAPPRSAS